MREIATDKIGCDLIDYFYFEKMDNDNNNNKKEIYVMIREYLFVIEPWSFPNFLWDEEQQSNTE